MAASPVKAPAKKPLTASQRAKSPGASDLPKWFKEIRAGADFIPNKVKPVSYNYMSLVETPNRSVIYGSSNPSIEGNRHPYSPATVPMTSSLGVGTYHRPTDEVGAGIKKNYNTIQDIKNIGGEVAGRLWGALKRVGDVLARPQYAVMNYFNENAKHYYTGANSAGGAKVTTGEQAQSILFGLTPAGLIRDIFSGRADDAAKNLWGGLSGQNKTQTHDILTTMTPGWLKEHPKLGTAASIAGDFVLDPLIFASVVSKPGSVIRAAGAGGNKLFGKTEAATRLWDETFFSAKGRTNAMQAMQKDFARKDIRKIEKKLDKIDKDAARTHPKQSATIRAQKTAQLTALHAARIDSDLQGAALAWRMVKTSLPTAGIGTVSRLSVGAAASAATKGAKLVREAHEATVAEVVASIKDDPKWFATWQAHLANPENITYQHGMGGQPYVVKLKEAKDYEDFLRLIVGEAAPIAKYAEHTRRAATSRKGRIIITEGRGKDFMNAFQKHVERRVESSLTPDELRLVRSRREMSNEASTSLKATDDDLKDPTLVRLHEDDLPHVDYERLKADAKERWELHNEGKKYRDSKLRVIVTDSEGGHTKVSLATLRRHANASERHAARRASGDAAAAARSPRQKALDEVTSVGNRAAARRAEWVEAVKAAQATSNPEAIEKAKQAEVALNEAEENHKIAQAANAEAQAAQKADPVAHEIVTRINSILNNDDGLSLEEHEKLMDIFNDSRMPIAERLSLLLSDDIIDNEQAADIIKQVFNAYIKDNRLHVSTTGEGSGLESIPQILDMVMRDRFGARISEGMQQASAMTVDDVKLQIGRMEKLVGTPDYRRDVNAEVGMLILDGYRQALETAIHSEDMLQNPDKLFATINDTMVHFMNEASADTKMQVSQLLFNMTGIRLPENFVPTAAHVDFLIGEKKFQFLKGNGEPADQASGWRSLGILAQNWVTKSFSFITTEPFTTTRGVNAQTGKNMEKFLTEMQRLAQQRGLNDTPHGQKILELRARVDKLNEGLISIGRGTIQTHNGPVEAVNRYTPLDFLIHHESILKAQKTTLVIGKNKAGRAVNSVQTGRLSALDSFTFVEKESAAGIEAIKTLHSLAKNDTEIGKMARRELADLFIKSGGEAHVQGLIPNKATGELADLNYYPLFRSLGTHAALKEEAVSGGFTSAWRADIMESMWGVESLLHNWQKAFQNKILHDVYIKGMTHEQSAKKMAENIKATFENHEKVKRLLYPVKNVDVTNATTGLVTKGKELEPSYLRTLGTNLQKSWGNNPIETARNTPGVEQRTPAKFEVPPGVDVEKPRITKPKVATPDDHLASLAKDPQVGKNIALQLIDPRQGNAALHYILNDKGEVVGRFTEQQMKVGGRVTGSRIRVHMNGNPNVGIPGPGETLSDLFKGAIEDSYAPYDPAVAGHDYAPNAVLANTPKIVGPKTVREPGAAAKAGVAANRPEMVTAAKAFDTAGTARQAGRTAKEAQVAYHDALREAGTKPPADTTKADELAEEVKKLEQEQSDKQAIYDSTPEDPADFGNVTNGKPDLDTADENAITNWVRETYAGAPPDEVAEELENVGRSLASDLVIAQARMVSANLNMNIKHGSNAQFAGLPFLSIGAAQNPVNTVAQVVALDTHRGWATRFLANKLSYVPEVGERASKYQEWYIKVARMSKVLEGSLNKIRAGVVNQSEVERKTVIARLNDWYMNRLNKGEFVNTNVTNMSKSQRRKYVRDSFFDPNLGKVPDKLDEFLDVNGTNAAREIEADFQTISDQHFARDNHKVNVDTLETLNRYLDRKFRFNPLTVRELGNIDHPIFTREWLVEASKTTQGSHLKGDIDIAEFHYAVHDASLKVHTGRMLHQNTFEEFAFVMDPKLAKMYNQRVPTETNGARGEIVSLADLHKIEDIPEGYIPTHMKNDPENQWFIDKAMIPEIKLMFDYMDGVHAINDTLNVGFVNKVLGYFKASVTIYKVPTYPVKNTISDLFMGAMDGLLNPKYYKWAAEVQAGNHKAMKEVDVKDYQGLLDQRFLSAENAKAAHDPTTVKQIDDIAPNMRTRLHLLTADGDYKLNDAQIMALYEELGLGQNRVAGNFVESVAATRKTSVSRGAGRVHDLFKNTNDVREDWGRLAHFMYALEKEAPLGGGFEDVIRRAADRVMKYHFDYGDVSIWERNRVARYIPFYKWVKNVVPFTLASVVTKPRYIMAEQAITQGTAFAINDDKEDVGFKDFVMPEYMEGQNAVSTGWMMDNVGNKFNQYLVMNMPLSETMYGTIAPVIDPWLQSESGAGPRDRVIESGKGVFGVGGSMMNPLIQGAVQGATGMKMWSTGAAPEKEGDDWLKTMSAAIPGYATLDSMNKQRKSGDKTNDMTGKNRTAGVMDALGIGKVYNNTEDAQLGSLNVTEDRLQGSLKARKAVIAKRVKAKWPHLTDEQSAMVVDEYIKQQRVTSGTHL